MRTARRSLLTAVLLLALAAPAFAAYPKSIFGAVKKVYAPRKFTINEFCYRTINGKRYVLVAVTFASGKAGTVALEWIHNKGYFAMWRDGALLHAVPKRDRARVRALVKRIRRECA